MPLPFMRALYLNLQVNDYFLRIIYCQDTVEADDLQNFLVIVGFPANIGTITMAVVQVFGSFENKKG